MEDAKIAEELSNLARTEQLKEQQILESKQKEEDVLEDKLEDMQEKDAELQQDITQLTTQDDKLKDTVEEEKKEVSDLEQTISEDQANISQLREDYEKEKNMIEEEKQKAEKERLETQADNERTERMKMIVKTMGLDLKKIHANREKLTTFFSTKKKKDLEYPSDLQRVNNEDVQRLLEELWTKEVIEGYSFLELLEAVLKNIDEVDLKMLNKYLELIKANIELDILLINGKLLDDIFGYDEEITGDVTDIGLSTLIEREFVVDDENPQLTPLKLQFLATLLLNPDILDIEYMQHFESRSIRNKYAKLVMRHL